MPVKYYQRFEVKIVSEPAVHEVFCPDVNVPYNR